MSDFQTANINELLSKVEKEPVSEDDKAYSALMKEDAELLTKFPSRRDRFNWPSPVKKRFLR